MPTDPTIVDSDSTPGVRALHPLHATLRGEDGLTLTISLQAADGGATFTLTIPNGTAHNWRESVSGWEYVGHTAPPAAADLASESNPLV